MPNPILSIKQLDWSGLFTLLLSITTGLLTAGLIWIWWVIKVHHTAKYSQANLSPKTWLLLGKRLRHNQPDKDYQQRLDQVIVACQQSSPTILMLLGGTTHHNTVSESQAGLSYLIHNQPDCFNHPKFILNLEQNSQNTLENLKEIRQALTQQKTSLEVSLITNRYHLARSQAMAQTLGFQCHFIPAETHYTFSLLQTGKILIEAFYLNWYTTGKAFSQLFKIQHMLKKIQ